MNLSKEKLWTKNFIIASSINFFLTLIYYLLIATMAMYAVNQFQASTSEAGLVAGIFIIGTLFGRLFIGRYLDTLGRKKVFYAGFIFMLLSVLCYFIANHLSFLIFNRLFHGFAYGMISTVTGIVVAQIIPPGRRGEGIGIYSLSVILATAIGPFLGLYLSHQFSFTVIFQVCFVLAVSNFLVSLFLKIPPPLQSKKQGQETKKFSITHFIEPKAVSISLLILVSGFCYSSIISFLSFYATEINLVQTASFFFVIYALVNLISRPFAGRLFDLKGPNIIMYPALLLYAGGLLLLSKTNHGFTLLIAGALIGLGAGNFQSNGQAFAIKVSPPHRIGLATSTFFIFLDLGFGIGPYLQGLLIPSTGYRGLYMIMAIIILICIIPYHFLCGKNSKAKTTQNTTALDS